MTTRTLPVQCKCPPLGYGELPVDVKMRAGTRDRLRLALRTDPRLESVSLSDFIDAALVAMQEGSWFP